MEDKFKSTEEERNLADKRVRKIFEKVQDGQISEDDAVEQLSKVHVEWEKRYYEQCNKEYDEHIEKNKGKKIIGYDTETFWPIFE